MVEILLHSQTKERETGNTNFNLQPLRLLSTLPFLFLIRKYSLLADKFYSGCLKAVDQRNESRSNVLTKFFLGKENNRNDMIVAQHVFHVLHIY